MLVFCGNVYAQSIKDMNEIADVLKNNGYSVAYQSEQSGAIIKEVSSLDELENTET